jgi:hypothetical protein
MPEIRAKRAEWTARALRKIENFPANSLLAGKIGGEPH